MVALLITISDKCVLNRFGYKLSDLTIVGSGNGTVIESSVQNTCRGKLHYEHGTMYVFEIIGHSDCGTQTIQNSTHVTYKSRIQGTKEAHNTDFEIIQENVNINFECSLEL